MPPKDSSSKAAEISQCSSRFPVQASPRLTARALALYKNGLFFSDRDFELRHCQLTLEKSERNESPRHLAFLSAESVCVSAVLEIGPFLRESCKRYDYVRKSLIHNISTCENLGVEDEVA